MRSTCAGRPAVRATLLATVALLAACGRTEEPPRNLILVTIDTYRADHFLGERAGRRLTPTLDRLARESVRFSQAASASNATSPGTAGLFTGLYPHRSGVIKNNHELAGHLPSLARVLSDAGFQTGGFQSNPVLGKGSGFEGGFDSYTRIRPRPAEDGTERAKARAGAVTSAGLEWLAGIDPGRPFFLWLHFMEPHGPYEPPAEARRLFPKEAFDGSAGIPLLTNNSGDGGIPKYQQVSAAPEDVADGRDYVARYAAEVWDLDRVLGEALESLRKGGHLDDALLVLTADHGEALNDDHGRYFSHANGLTLDQLHVPLLLRYPGCEAGTQVDRPVSTVDVLPTVLGLLGVEAGFEMDGVDLLRPGERAVVSQCDKEVAVRVGDWKLRRTTEGEVRLHDLADTYGEESDVAGEHPDVLRRLRTRLDQIEARPALAEPTERTPGTRRRDR